jgi:hypothetical protein
VTAKSFATKRPRAAFAANLAANATNPAAAIAKIEMIAESASSPIVTVISTTDQTGPKGSTSRVPSPPGRAARPATTNRGRGADAAGVAAAAAGGPAPRPTANGRSVPSGPTRPQTGTSPFPPPTA